MLPYNSLGTPGLTADQMIAMGLMLPPGSTAGGGTAGGEGGGAVNGGGTLESPAAPPAAAAAPPAVSLVNQPPPGPVAEIAGTQLPQSLFGSLNVMPPGQPNFGPSGQTIGGPPPGPFTRTEVLPGMPQRPPLTHLRPAIPERPAPLVPVQTAEPVRSRPRPTSTGCTRATARRRSSTTWHRRSSPDRRRRHRRARLARYRLLARWCHDASQEYRDAVSAGLGGGTGGPFTEDQYTIYARAMRSKFGNATVPTAEEFARLSPAHRAALQAGGFPYGA